MDEQAPPQIVVFDDDRGVMDWVATRENLVQYYESSDRPERVDRVDDHILYLKRYYYRRCKQKFGE